MISSVPLACASRRGIPAAVRRLLSIETGRRRHSRVGSHKFSPTVMSSKCPPPSSTLQSLSSFQEADDLNAPDPTRYCQNFDVRSSVSILESWIERLDIDKQRPSLQESHNLACLVPNNSCLQKLVQLGADLSKMENIPGVANMLVKADFDKMIAPKLWILSDRGFELSQIARLISVFPKIFKDVFVVMTKMLGFSLPVTREMMVKCPRLIITSRRVLCENFYHLNSRLNLSLDVIAKSPKALTSCPRILTERTNFLVHCKLFQPDGRRPLYTPLDSVVDCDDKTFCRRFAQSKGDLFDAYLKTL
ncbi:unnamed protein product [Schistocephalus solidus]|uniref:mTERF domain-containing protein 1 n=1 Tax=Schistocephalus solidus TaxID=70667 RepID=A0A183S7S5_SCHSO|nr:unnamed protein product [Schistocephalus solidus]